MKQYAATARMMKLCMFVLAILAAATATSVPDPAMLGCQSKCGNITIPYPFGLTKECYFDEQFLITCNTTFHPPQAFLTNSNIPVLDISLEGHLRITAYVAYRKYYSGNTSSHYTASLNLAKFTLSNTKNKFTVIGCDAYGFIDGSRGQEFSTACLASCQSITDVVNGSCSGIGCCQTIIPENVRRYNISLYSSGDQHVSVSGVSNVSYGFLVEDGFYNFSSSHLKVLPSTSFPIFVDWSIGNQTCVEAKKNQTNYVCKENSNCSDSKNGPGYLCNCAEGFVGNPYLQNGCVDINECETDSHLCNPNSTCHNYPGGYNCSCPPGYTGDGWKNGTSCRAIGKSKRFPVDVVLGVSISLLVLLLLVSWFHIALRQRKLNKLREKFFEQNGGGLLKSELSRRRELSNESAQIFTEEDLKKATANFHESRVVGRGGQGIVYKGILPDQSAVAIKKSSRIGDQKQVEEFINEVIVVSQINHRNVVKLLGCCLETQVPLLVYEFVTNGTLFHHIHNVEENSLIPWKTRFKIAIETAGALSYLHSAASTPIIHRDIKSSNILLDDDCTAKVADFGASRLIPCDQTEYVTLVQGTLGYMDPEYIHTSQLTDKSDVYSFGVVLAELLTGRKAFSFQNPEDTRNLATVFVSAIKEDRLVEVLDHRVVKASNIEQVMEVAMLARRCVKVKGEERPSMKEVAYKLEGLRAIGDPEECEVFLTKPIIAGNHGDAGSTTVYFSMNNLEIEAVTGR